MLRFEGSIPVYALDAPCHMSKNGGRLVIEMEDGGRQSIPLLQVRSIAAGPRSQMTTQLIFALLRQETPVFYVDRQWRISGTVGLGSAALWRLERQMACFCDSEQQMAFAKETIQTKLLRQRQVLLQYGKRVNSFCLADAVQKLSACAAMTGSARTVDTLMGIEGTGARAYFGAFSALLDDSLWHWKGRRQRRAQDPVNALLNYGYAFLEGEVRVAAAASGLDGRIGFLHANNGRKDSLIYDLMELFRAEVTDRFVLTLLRRGTFMPSHFERHREGIRLTKEAALLWAERYERYMERSYQSLGGLAPRAWIRKEIERSAAECFGTGRVLIENAKRKKSEEA